MTKNRDRKQLVRERMAKTGESYATARRQIDGATPVAGAPKGWSLMGSAHELIVEAVDVDGRPQMSACVRSRARA